MLTSDALGTAGTVEKPAAHTRCTEHCTLRGGELSLLRAAELQEKKKGVTAGRVPLVNEVNQDANAAAAKHSFQHE